MTPSISSSAQVQAPSQTVEDLGKLVKQKFPGSYDSLSDVDVGVKVKAKYPQYAQFADMPAVTATTVNKKLQPSRTKSGFLPGAMNLPRNASKEDIEADRSYREALHHRADTRGMDEITFGLGASQLTTRALMGSAPFWSTIAQTGKKAATGVATGAAVGYGARKAAKAVGLPEWAADSIAGIASIYGASKGEQAIEFWQKAESPSINKFLQWVAKGRPTLTPMVPGKGTAVKYGGPTEQQFSPPNRLTPRKPGWTAPEPEAPTPFPKGKGTNTKYGGPTEPEYSGSSEPVKRIFGKPARKLGPMSPEAPAEPVVPKAPKPFKKGPGRNMPKYGGPAEPEYGPAPSRVVKQAGVRPQPPVAEEGGEGLVDPSGKPITSTSTARYKTTEPQPQTGLSSRELNPGKVINTQAEAKNLAFAKRFKSVGMTPERIQNMTESEYEQYRLALNAERKAAGLSQFEKPRPGVNRRSFAELKADIIRAMKGTQ